MRWQVQKERDQLECCHSSQVKQVRQILLTEISLDCSYQYGDLNESSFSVMIKKTQIEQDKGTW